MRMILLLSGLTGWLVFELRDFINNGGFEHALAFNLLKIIFIMVFWLTIGTVISLKASVVNARKKNPMKQLDSDDGSHRPQAPHLPDLGNDIKTFRQSINTFFRKRSI